MEGAKYHIKDQEHATKLRELSDSTLLERSETNQLVFGLHGLQAM